MLRRRLVVTLLALSVLAAGCAEEDEASDRDGDGLRDAVETTPAQIAVVRADGEVRLDVTSDPDVRDTDGDGLEDLDERVRGSDPRDVDTDQDGLLDGHNATLAPDDPRVDAWRARGILEQPALTFAGELGFCSQYGGLKSHLFSSDRPRPDGLGEVEEMRGWDLTLEGRTLRVASDPCVADTDGDGLADDLEKTLGGHPQRTDTDGDGVVDGEDADPAHDLGILVERVSATRDEGGPVRLVLTHGSAYREADAGEMGEIALAVHDATLDRESLPTVAAMAALEPDADEGVDLFPHGAGAQLTFDLAAGTLEVAGDTYPEGEVTLQGDEGSVTFTWRVTRA